MPDQNKTLREKVQETRDSASEIAKMLMINNLLQEVFYANKRVLEAQDAVKNTEKSIKTINYEVTKLDAEHPNFTQKKEYKEKEVTSLEKELECLNKSVENANKELERLNKEISKVEQGETKIMISDVKDYSDQLMKPSY